MKYLSKDIKYVGFDMDGTLYDEFEFISQVYEEISKPLGSEAYEYMCSRWIDKGSSYNEIFDEAFDIFGSKLEKSKDEFVANSLNIFRNYSPSLLLTKRVKYLLEFYKENYEIFLISDGNPKLQNKKFLSLGLDKFFKNQSVIFTGEYDIQHHKPNTKSIELLDINVNKTIFFGDRDVDKKFAKDANMRFIKVYNMVEII
jgi:FMN phosphatase YigB (HAD superfamily)